MFDFADQDQSTIQAECSTSSQESDECDQLNRLQNSTPSTSEALCMGDDGDLTGTEDMDETPPLVGLKEKDVGIIEYISKHAGFFGILKQR